jgi:hypothetical protein
MQFINTKKPEAMTHVNFTTSGVALTDTQVARIREEIAVRRCLGVSTALREGVITIQIQEQDLRIWIKIE